MSKKRFSVMVESKKDYKTVLNVIQQSLETKTGIYWMYSPNILILPNPEEIANSHTNEAQNTDKQQSQDAIALLGEYFNADHSSKDESYNQLIARVESFLDKNSATAS